MRQKYGQAGSSGGRDKTPPPFCEAPILKRAKVLFIDDDIVSIRAGEMRISHICEAPKGIRAVASLEQAKRLVDEHEPDVVVSDKLFDERNPDACYELLAYIRGWNPSAKVVLRSGTLTAEDERRMRGYDAVVAKGEDILGVIERLVKPG